MQVEAIKMNGHYFIPYLDKIELKSNKIMVEIKNINLKKEHKREKSKSYKILEKANKKINSKFIKMLLKNTPKNYEYEDDGMSDKEKWFEEVRDKYEV